VVLCCALRFSSCRRVGLVNAWRRSSAAYYTEALWATRCVRTACGFEVARFGRKDADAADVGGGE